MAEPRPTTRGHMQLGLLETLSLSCQFPEAAWKLTYFNLENDLPFTINIVFNYIILSLEISEAFG